MKVSTLANLLAFFVHGVLAACLASPAMGDTEVADSPADEVRADIAYSPVSNRYLVVWEEQSGPIAAILGRILDDDGAPMGDAFPIATTGPQSRYAPRVSYNGHDDEFLVVYEYAFSSTDSDIRGQRVSPAPSLLGSEATLSATGASETLPAVAHDPVRNEYMIVYRIQGAGDDSAVHGKRFLADLTQKDGWVIADGSRDETFPSVAFTPTENAFFVAYEEVSQVGDVDLYVQRFDAENGGLLGGAINVSTATGDQLNPRIAYGGREDEFLVVFEDRRDPPPDGGDIRGQVLTSTGTAIGGEFVISGEGEDAARHTPAVAYQSSVDEFLVALALDFSDSDSDVLYARVGSNLDVRVQGIVSNFGTNELGPAVAAGPGSMFAIVWEDYRDQGSGNGADVYVDTLRVPVFSGAVYEGPLGDDSMPLVDVRVDLYCGPTENDINIVLGSVHSNPFGEYELVATRDCAYYRIEAYDLPGYVSDGAGSNDGTVDTANRIVFAAPLDGLDLSGNDFWDLPAPTATPTATTVPTATASATATSTATEVPTSTPTPTATPSASASATPTLTPTSTVVATATLTSSPTATTAMTPTAPPSESATPTGTAPVATATPTSPPPTATFPLPTVTLPLPTATHTSGIEPTPTRTPAPCGGDCNGDGDVTVDEVIVLVNIALGGADVTTCQAGDTSGDGAVTVDEIVAAVNNALGGCR